MAVCTATASTAHRRLLTGSQATLKEMEESGQEGDNKCYIGLDFSTQQVLITLSLVVVVVGEQVWVGVVHYSLITPHIFFQNWFLSIVYREVQMCCD